MMGYEMQTKFMEESNKDCEILSARGTVHWEWFYNWATTLDTYFPKFVGQNSCLNSFFLTNVPYNFLPPFPDPYIALNEEIFVFKPREWRGKLSTLIGSHNLHPHQRHHDHHHNLLHQEQTQTELLHSLKGTTSQRRRWQPRSTATILELWRTCISPGWPYHDHHRHYQHRISINFGHINNHRHQYHCHCIIINIIIITTSL